MKQVIILNNNNKAVLYLKRRCPILSKVIDMVGEISYTPHTDYYAFLIHSIIEQMLSVKVGQILFERLKSLCGGSVTPLRIGELSYEDLHGIGLSRHKVSYIQSLTEAILNDKIHLNSLDELSDEEIIRELTQIRGIGNWTAKMFLIFCLNRPDVLPYEDLTFTAAYKWAYNARTITPGSVSRRLKKWKPYSSIGARFLYRAFDKGFVNKPLSLD